MAQTYTLEEAADKLNLSVEEFKRRLRTEWTQIRSFRDGSTLRFRANEVDELARSYGLGSSDELPLSEGSGQDIPTQAPAAPTTADDTFALAPGGSSGRHKTGKPDSDVRLEKASDVKKPAGDEESILTEEFETPAAGGSGKLSGKSGKLSSTRLKSGDSGRHKAEATTSDSGKQKTGSSGKHPAPGSSGKHKKPDDSSSEFELSLDPDSDEFELSLAPDSSEEVALGEMPPEAGSGSKKTGSSGINLNRPTDSGVSLEKKKKDDEEVDFELSLDAPGSGTSAKKLSSGKLKADSDSEFELTLEEPSDGGLNAAAAAEAEKKGDIFEATDFEIPALEDDSASEAVSLDEADTDLESSDFDLALDEGDASAEEESASEVVALEEGGKARRKPKKRPIVDDEAVDLSDPDLEEGPSASAALRGVRPDEEEEDYEVSEAAEDEGRPVAVAGPTSWGPIPAIFMFPTVLVMFLGTLMAFELLHSTWGYQQANKPTTPLVDFFADKFVGKPAQ